MKAVTGNTFPVKDQIKSLGGRWDGTKKCWNVPDDKFDAAMALVTGAGPKGSYVASTGPVRAAPRPSKGWRPCGYPGCNRAHCDECDGAGFYG
jgi:hypothetical protein